MNEKYEYIYHNDFEYVGKALLQLDPLESKKQGKDIYMLPSQKATTTKPNIKEGFTPVYNKEKDIWENVVDNRDKIYYKNGVKVEFKLGDEITSDMSKEQYTKEQIETQKKEQELFKQKELISKQKIEGVEYKHNDKIYKISLTTQDQNGLNAIKSALELGLEYTNFNFENGTIFKITKDNFRELALFFVKERNKFYI
jgi:hypothetical protein